MSNLDLLREVEQIVHEPQFDELIETRDRRTRGARLVTAAALTLAAIAVVASVVSTGLDTNPEPQPIAPTPSPEESETQARPLVYTDDYAFDENAFPNVLIHVRTLHVGDRLVRVDQEVNGVRVWSIAVTDDGAAYVQIDHSVWFTDGSRPRQIAQRSCGSPSADDNGLGFGNVGPLVAWFDCSPASLGDLVIYDTSLKQEVARYVIPRCQVVVRRDEIDAECHPQAIIGDHLYLGRDIDRSGRLKEDALRLDLSSGQVISANPQMYVDDLRAHPRALVIGDSWETGTPSDSADFLLDGSRLIPGGPAGSADTGFQPTEAFDTATGKPVRLRIPKGYHPGANNPDLSGDRMFTLVEWLDDDTVALQHADDNGDDILTCHLSDGRCVLAAESDGKSGHLAPQPAGSQLRNLPG